jgi:hypothetical protein
MAFQYAPLLIPTLCRYKHFVNCVESLRNNSLAKETALYIALDYPLKKEHEDGYEKILAYLDTITGFKELIVIKRDINYGTSKNIREAKQVILQNYDYFILSEDDNIFSPNFLEFMNKGLEKFKDDKTVLAISGYRHFYNIEFNKNNFFRQAVDFSSWGYGIWRDRYEEYQAICTNKYFRRALVNPIKAFRVWKNGANMLLNLFYYARNSWDGVIIDSVLSVYMALERKTVIMPTVSKVRNTGWDGSGIHFLPNNVDLAEKHLNQVIDTNAIFDFYGDGWEFFKKNRRIYIDESYGRISFFFLIVHFLSRRLKILIQFIKHKPVKSL